VTVSHIVYKASSPTVIAFCQPIYLSDEFPYFLCGYFLHVRYGECYMSSIVFVLESRILSSPVACNRVFCILRKMLSVLSDSFVEIFSGASPYVRGERVSPRSEFAFNVTCII
jgi:hypothetical protein